MNANERREQLLSIFENADEMRDIVAPLIDEIVYLETELADLKKLPRYRVNPKNPAQQKPTQAAFLYKQTNQQYNSCIKTLINAYERTDKTEEDSPLRAFVKALANNE